MERLSSGIPALDVILGGGLPRGALVILGGGPGTGKTILAQQICFANASTDHRALYYTTLSEPHSKLIEHMKSFPFFDAEALTRTIDFQHIAPLVAEKGVDAWATEAVHKSFEEQPSIIVVDSSKALAEYARSDGYRAMVYELASKIAHTRAVLMFVGEYTLEDTAKAPEFAVADVIIHLANEPRGVSDRRWLRVLKVRGSDYLTGRHSLRIGPSGFEVFPRLEALPAARSDTPEERVSSGIPRLDEMIGGGIPGASATLIVGPSGAGKTVVGLHFVVQGVRRGERSLYVSFQESERQLLRKASSFGWDLNEAVSNGLLRVISVQPVEMGLDAVASTIREAVLAGPARRIVLDSIGELEHAARGTDRFADFVWALVELFRSAGACAILTSETAAFFGPSFELARGLSFVVDNVILLRYAELESEIRRAIGIVKMRDSDHAKNLVEFTIDKNGLQVKGKFAGLSGVLTGTPRPTAERFREFFDR